MLNKLALGSKNLKVQHQINFKGKLNFIFLESIFVPPKLNQS